ncbi:MAG: hypothetical protein AAFR38_02480 [Planctomycetota bacterium]
MTYSPTHRYQLTLVGLFVGSIVGFFVMLTYWEAMLESVPRAAMASIATALVAIATSSAVLGVASATGLRAVIFVPGGLLAVLVSVVAFLALSGGGATP